jgi:hypothetical protein
METQSLIKNTRERMQNAKPFKDETERVQWLYLLHEMKKRLSIAEISTLLRATDIREFGLRMARTGKLSDAETAVNYARIAIQAKNLCREACTMFECFQAPASAFIRYKQGKYQDAHALLDASLDACNILIGEYDYQMEARRIHLCRNVIRVNLGSNNLLDAATQAPLLVGYIQGDVTMWPLPSQSQLAAAKQPIEWDLRLKLIDQLLEDLALLAEKDATLAGKALQETCLLVQKWDKEMSNPGSILVWLAAMVHYNSGDLVGFVHHASLFFSSSPDQLPCGWKALLRALCKVEVA